MASFPNPIDVHVGGRVRSLRISRGMSMERLAMFSGVPVERITSYELGFARIGVGHLAAISDALNVPIAAFFDGMCQQSAICARSAPRAGSV